MDLTGISTKWDTAVADLQTAVAAAQQSDPVASAVSAALDTAADQVAAQTAALRSLAGLTDGEA